MTRALLFAGVLVFACAGVAEARGWQTRRAESIAEQVWGFPCPAGLAIRFEDPATAGVVHESAGWARQGVCVVHLNPAVVTVREFAPFCTAVIHETGHIAGYRDPSNMADPQHSDDPRSVMFARPLFERTVSRIAGRRRSVESWTGTDRRCRGRGLPFLRLNVWLR